MMNFCSNFFSKLLKSKNFNFLSPSKLFENVNVIRLETDEEPERFFDLKVGSRLPSDCRGL